MEYVTVPVWWKRGGGMMTRRDCLGPDHPEHTYNWFKREYPDLKPEDYGVYHPDVEKYSHMSKNELMVEVMELAMQNRAWEDASRMWC